MFHPKDGGLAWPESFSPVAQVTAESPLEAALRTQGAVEDWEKNAGFITFVTEARSTSDQAIIVDSRGRAFSVVAQAATSLRDEIFSDAELAIDKHRLPLRERLEAAMSLLSDRLFPLNLSGDEKSSASELYLDFTAASYRAWAAYQTERAIGVATQFRGALGKPQRYEVFRSDASRPDYLEFAGIVPGAAHTPEHAACLLLSETPRECSIVRDVLIDEHGNAYRVRSEEPIELIPVLEFEVVRDHDRGLSFERGR